RELNRNIYVIPPGDIYSRVMFFSELGIDILICGAVSQLFEQRLTAAGIKISPWFRGGIDEIIAAHTSGRLQSENFFMPGCHRGRGAGRGRYCGRRGAGFGRRRYNQEDS
ncbi:MAG: NifB/NifX family molybdenum-iron cluster-binding protein, partial [Candidatus Zixiibacteriota bacterium]